MPQMRDPFSIMFLNMSEKGSLKGAGSMALICDIISCKWDYAQSLREALTPLKLSIRIDYSSKTAAKNESGPPKMKFFLKGVPTSRNLCFFWK